MYDTHTTEAIVLDSTEAGEADRDLILLTKDLGVVRARIAGVRKVTSKNRFHILEGMRAQATLVKGRAFWRVTSMRDSELEVRNRYARVLHARLAVLLKRLVHGEGSESELFGYLEEAFKYIDRVQPAVQVYEDLEYLIALRICDMLGYVGHEARVAHLLRRSSISDSDIAEAKEHRAHIAQIVNSALYASHM